MNFLGSLGWVVVALSPPNCKQTSLLVSLALCR